MLVIKIIKSNCPELVIQSEIAMEEKTVCSVLWIRREAF